MMNQLDAMRVFVRVVDSESFRRAAQQLDVSNAFVTRSIAMLESHLQTRLINRTTRNLSLTEAGAHYLEGCRALIEELDHLESTVESGEGEPNGTLRVVASGALSLLALTPLLEGFRRKYPKITVRLTLAEHRVDLIEDGFDVGIVTPFMVTSLDLVERPIASDTFVAVAAPGYLAARGTPQTPRDLLAHASIALPVDMRSATWHFRAPGETAEAVTLVPVYAVNSALMVRQAVLSGMGFAVLPHALVADDLASGKLERVLPEHTIDDPDVKVSIVYPGRQYLPAKTRCFIDYTLEKMASGASAAPEASAAAEQPPPPIYVHAAVSNGAY